MPGQSVVTAGTILRDDAAAADEFSNEEHDTKVRSFTVIPDYQFVERNAPPGGRVA